MSRHPRSHSRPRDTPAPRLSALLAQYRASALTPGGGLRAIGNLRPPAGPDSAPCPWDTGEGRTLGPWLGTLDGQPPPWSPDAPLGGDPIARFLAFKAGYRAARGVLKPGSSDAGPSPLNPRRSWLYPLTIVKFS